MLLKGVSVLVPFSNVAAFDSYVRDLDSLLVSTFECPTTKKENLQFYYTSWCALLVDSSRESCNPSAVYPQVCTNRVRLFREKLLAAFSDPAECSASASADGAKKRADTVAALDTLVGRIRGSNPCIDGVSTDLSQCGFFSATDALAYCAANSLTDACCARVQGFTGPTIAPSTAVASEVTTTAARVTSGLGKPLANEDPSATVGAGAAGTGAAVAATGTSSPASSSGSNMALIGGGIGAAVVVIVVIIVAVVVVNRRKRARRPSGNVIGSDSYGDMGKGAADMKRGYDDSNAYNNAGRSGASGYEPPKKENPYTQPSAPQPSAASYQNARQQPPQQAPQQNMGRGMYGEQMDPHAGQYGNHMYPPQPQAPVPVPVQQQQMPRQPAQQQQQPQPPINRQPTVQQPQQQPPQQPAAPRQVTPPPAMNQQQGMGMGMGMAAAAVGGAAIGAAANMKNNSNQVPEEYMGAEGVEILQIAETMEAVYNYVPNLSDELQLYVGDAVLVKCKFDDGWAYGMNMTTKEEGSFPLACLSGYAEPVDAGYEGSQRPISEAPSERVRQRMSSIYGPPPGMSITKQPSIKKNNSVKKSNSVSRRDPAAQASAAPVTAAAPEQKTGRAAVESLYPESTYNPPLSMYESSGRDSEYYAPPASATPSAAGKKTQQPQPQQARGAVESYYPQSEYEPQGGSTANNGQRVPVDSYYPESEYNPAPASQAKQGGAQAQRPPVDSYYPQSEYDPQDQGQGNNQRVPVDSYYPQSEYEPQGGGNGQRVPVDSYYPQSEYDPQQQGQGANGQRVPVDSYYPQSEYDPQQQGQGANGQRVPVDSYYPQSEYEPQGGGNGQRVPVDSYYPQSEYDPQQQGQGANGQRVPVDSYYPQSEYGAQQGGNVPTDSVYYDKSNFERVESYYPPQGGQQGGQTYRNY
ncbi:hypothetical protein HDU96_008755 [Phlyctochytrium bullatum]|nr:hypothetical protein HDU96_008755 [Phlyctochytrium bullatum]